ncbi:MAG: hypothetical protein DDT19_01870 [Syntrophomonadaceae bacterium]|nr:hypothetical protein [Bacillota bacterium]
MALVRSKTLETKRGTMVSVRIVPTKKRTALLLAVALSTKKVNICPNLTKRGKTIARAFRKYSAKALIIGRNAVNRRLKTRTSIPSPPKTPRIVVCSLRGNILSSKSAAPLASIPSRATANESRTFFI